MNVNQNRSGDTENTLTHDPIHVPNAPHMAVTRKPCNWYEKFIEINVVNFLKAPAANI